jgi:hypothetical protein
MVSGHAVMGVKSVEQLIPFLRWQRRFCEHASEILEMRGQGAASFVESCYSSCVTAVTSIASKDSAWRSAS